MGCIVLAWEDRAERLGLPCRTSWPHRLLFGVLVARAIGTLWLCKCHSSRAAPGISLASCHLCKHTTL